MDVGEGEREKERERGRRRRSSLTPFFPSHPSFSLLSLSMSSTTDHSLSIVTMTTSFHQNASRSKESESEHVPPSPSSQSSSFSFSPCPPLSPHPIQTEYRKKGRVHSPRLRPRLPQSILARSRPGKRPRTLVQIHRVQRRRRASLCTFNLASRFPRLLVVVGMGR